MDILYRTQHHPPGAHAARAATHSGHHRHDFCRCTYRAARPAPAQPGQQFRAVRQSGALLHHVSGQSGNEHAGHPLHARSGSYAGRPVVCHPHDSGLAHQPPPAGLRHGSGGTDGLHVCLAYPDFLPHCHTIWHCAHTQCGPCRRRHHRGRHAHAAGTGGSGRHVQGKRHGMVLADAGLQGNPARRPHHVLFSAPLPLVFQALQRERGAIHLCTGAGVPGRRSDGVCRDGRYFGRFPCRPGAQPAHSARLTADEPY